MSKVKHLISYRVWIKSGISDSRVQALSYSATFPLQAQEKLEAQLMNPL